MKLYQLVVVFILMCLFVELCNPTTNFIRSHVPQTSSSSQSQDSSDDFSLDSISSHAASVVSFFVFDFAKPISIEPVSRVLPLRDQYHPVILVPPFLG